MEDLELKQLVADTGRILVEKKLVARTWGNISARKDGSRFAISPSGMGYDRIGPEDVPIFNSEDGTYEGSRKPSSEKKIHAVIYDKFSDAGFVIHTHQDYATAAGLGRESELAFTEEEEKILGNVKTAKYGLPGTKKLKKAVSDAVYAGGETILMKHHGVVVFGKDRDEAILKAETLENACKRNVAGKIGSLPEVTETSFDLSTVLSVYPGARLVKTKETVALSKLGTVRPQLDDLAQMVGTKLKCVDASADKIVKTLAKSDAVLVKGVGCIIKADDPEDADALELLIQKTAICLLYTKACGINTKLSGFDCALMHFVYKRKYSKKKEA